MNLSEYRRFRAELQGKVSRKYLAALDTFNDAHGLTVGIRGYIGEEVLGHNTDIYLPTKESQVAFDFYREIKDRRFKPFAVEVKAAYADSRSERFTIGINKQTCFFLLIMTWDPFDKDQPMRFFKIPPTEWFPYVTISGSKYRLSMKTDAFYETFEDFECTVKQWAN